MADRLTALDLAPEYALPVTLVIGLGVSVTVGLHRLLRLSRLELAAAAILATQIIVAAFLAVVFWSLAATPRRPEDAIGYAYAIYDLAAKWFSSLAITLPSVIITIVRLRKKSRESDDDE